MAKRPKEPSSSDDAELDAEVASLPFEAAVERLESIIERIEDGSVGLEETLGEYRRGHALLRRCRAILDGAEREIRRLSLDELENPRED
jgi:exodeoxyribonuclease VII small subunit